MGLAADIAFYDTNISTNNKDEIAENFGEIFVRKGIETAIIQFDISNFKDVTITSANLFLYCKKSVADVTITPKLYDVPVRLSKVSYNTFSKYMNKLILESANKYTFASTSWEYNDWISIKITDLLTGNLGKTNFTILLESDSKSQVRFYGIEYGTKPYIEIDISRVAPLKPTIIYPNGEALENSGSIRFQWKYNAVNSAGQKKYEFEWKMQSETTWKTDLVTSANQYHDINASVFQNGIVEWRIRTYNQFGMTSDYMVGQFYIIGRPANPEICEIKNNAITEISWMANKSEESAANIKIKSDNNIIFDSGKISGGISDVYIPNIMLSDGAYVALLKISNLYDMWSNTISRVFNIGGARPSQPFLKVMDRHDYVHLEITGTAPQFFVFRYDERGGESIPIARISTNIYDDYSVCSGRSYGYFIRAYDSSYSDSDSEYISVKYSGFYISSISKMDERVNLIQHDSEYYTPFTGTLSTTSSLINYTGREYPVRESGIFKDQEISIEAFMKYRDVELFEKIVERNEVCCIRNNEMVFYCDISSFSRKKVDLLGGYIVNFTAEKVDYSEAVRFNV